MTSTRTTTASAVTAPGTWAARPGALVTAIQRFAADPNSVMERQVCTAGVYLLRSFCSPPPG